MVNFFTACMYTVSILMNENGHQSDKLNVDDDDDDGDIAIINSTYNNKEKKFLIGKAHLLD
ncbi:hypothetical protein DERP_000320 [Dermatophagoides pteronyssinus]|uniref:Uncharacterized protein n=1 Tax=Dermatophagoides pteronyssinus TaxID=6956 RepID=A0ABQ8J071_DERPT|nr:hypothetical protein DERP_000320 [Dermatophagoides pteronyssinus]